MIEADENQRRNLGHSALLMKNSVDHTEEGIHPIDDQIEEKYQSMRDNRVQGREVRLRAFNVWTHVDISSRLRFHLGM